MPSKRERELARAKYQRQQVRRAHRRTRNRFLQVLAGATAIAGILIVMNLLNNGATEPDPTLAQPTDIASAAPVTLSTNAPIAGCETPATVRANNITYGEATTDLPSVSSFSLETNCGAITFTSDENAPTTAGTMAWLANSGFFNNTSCHRLTTQGIFVLQCGDPAGDGTGGPGFNFADENLPAAGADGNYIYPRGTVAMANSGPNTNGSQFFMVYQDSPLPPNYSVWGTIASGLDVLDNVASVGVLDGSSDGLPSQAVVISQATTTP